MPSGTRPKPPGGRRHCECCGATRCNKFFKLPVGTAPKTRVIRACGRCVTYNAKKLRAYLDQIEEELNAN